MLAVDNDGDCQHITVDGDGCVASVGSTAVTGAVPIQLFQSKGGNEQKILSYCCP